MGNRNDKLFFLIVLFFFFTACSSTISADLLYSHTSTPTSLIKTETNFKTRTVQVSSTLTVRPTVTPTNIPATPMHNTRLIYDPMTLNLKNPQETPIFSLTENNKWVPYLPNNIRNNLPQGWQWSKEFTKTIVDKYKMPIYKWNDGEWEVVDEFRLMSLQERLEAWKNGEISVKDEDLWTLFGDPHPLGLFDDCYMKTDSGPLEASRQYGVLLGFDVKDDYQILYIGYRDALGNQFFVPYQFSIWKLSEQEGKKYGLVYSTDRDIHDNTHGRTVHPDIVWKMLQERLGKVIGFDVTHERPNFISGDTWNSFSEVKKQRISKHEKYNFPTNRAFCEFLWRLKTTKNSYQNIGINEKFNINTVLESVPIDMLAISGVRLVVKDWSWYETD